MAAAMPCARRARPAAVPSTGSAASETTCGLKCPVLRTSLAGRPMRFSPRTHNPYLRGCSPAHLCCTAAGSTAPRQRRCSLGSSLAPPGPHVDERSSLGSLHRVAARAHRWQTLNRSARLSTHFFRRQEPDDWVKTSTSSLLSPCPALRVRQHFRSCGNPAHPPHC